MQTVHVQLEFPLDHVRDPILYHLVKDYHLIPNVRRAQIDIHSGGALCLEIEGAENDIQAGLEYVRGLGIAVTPIEPEW